MLEAHRQDGIRGGRAGWVRAGWLALLVCLPGVAAHAESARKLVALGNAAYGAGKFDEAIQHYQEASVAEPESPQIYYNVGNAQYRQGDFDAARESFEQAAVKSKEPALAARAQYNLGNCAFREAERQHDSDLKKALESAEQSIKHYQDSLQSNPKQPNAAENIEIVRLYVKNLLDEIKKQEEQQKQQQQQQENLAEKLKKLIERQQQEVKDNQALASDVQQNGQPADWKDKVASLSGDQSKLQEDTVKLLSEMDQTQQQMKQATAGQAAQGQGQGNTPPPPGSDAMAEKLEKAMGHTSESINEQAAAIKGFGNEKLDDARGHQSQSGEKLIEALKALSDDQQQQQQGDQQNQDQEDQKDQKDQQQGDQGDQDKQDREKQDGKQPEDQQSKDGQGEQPKQDEEQQRQAETARGILDEEKDNQNRRRPVQPGGYKAVDKNW